MKAGRDRPFTVDWKTGSGPTNSTPGRDQVFTIDANGIISITKSGQTVTRTASNIIVPAL